MVASTSLIGIGCVAVFTPGCVAQNNVLQHAEFVDREGFRLAHLNNWFG